MTRTSARERRATCDPYEDMDDDDDGHWDGGHQPKRPRGRPTVEDKRTRRVGMNSAEWERVVEMARADGYTSTSKWVRERLGV